MEGLVLAPHENAQFYQQGVYLASFSELVILKGGRYASFFSNHFSDWKPLPKEVEPGRAISSVKRDPEGRLWAISHDRGNPLNIDPMHPRRDYADFRLHVVDSNGLSHPEGGLHERRNFIEFIESDTELWLVTEKEAMALTGPHWTMFPFPEETLNSSPVGAYITGGGVLADGSVWVFLANHYLILENRRWTSIQVQSLPIVGLEANFDNFSFIGAGRIDETTMVAITMEPYHVFMFRSEEVRCVSCEYSLGTAQGLNWFPLRASARQHTWLDDEINGISPEPLGNIGTRGEKGHFWVPRESSIQDCSWERCLSYSFPEVNSAKTFSGPRGELLVVVGDTVKELVVPESVEPEENEQKFVTRTASGVEFWNRNMKISVKQNSEWLSLGLPSGRNCPGFFGIPRHRTLFPATFLIQAQEEAVLTWWCGVIQRLGPLGWETVTPLDGAIPDGTRKNFASVLHFHSIRPQSQWAYTTDGRVLHSDGKIWKEWGMVDFFPLGSGSLLLDDDSVFIFSYAGHRAHAKDGKVIQLEPGSTQLPVETWRDANGRFLGITCPEGEPCIEFELNTGTLQWAVKDAG